MARSDHHRGRLGRLRGVLAITSVALAATAAVCYGSYFTDRLRLRQVARQVTADCTLPSEKVLGLMEWVYSNQGFRKNRRYFVLRSLEATPAQVLEDGGDCADKSRLLSALLREIRIPNTMLMCFSRVTGEPSHTVVEARVEGGSFMVVDPVYRLWFPREGSPGYHGLLELRADPGILERRIEEMCRTAPRRSPLHSYNRQSAVYDHASSVNWSKNRLTRAVGEFIQARRGDEVYRWPRPVVLEEPKLFMTAALAAAAAACLALWLACGQLRTAREASFPAGALACGR